MFLPDSVNGRLSSSTAMQSEEQLDKDLTPETEPTVQSTVTIL